MDSTAENEASADTNGGLNVWQLDDDLEYDCNCPGPPPPVFKIPPPPRPPFMPEIDCSDFNTQDFDSCDLMTVSMRNNGFILIPPFTSYLIMIAASNIPFRCRHLRKFEL